MDKVYRCVWLWFWWLRDRNRLPYCNKDGDGNACISYPKTYIEDMYSSRLEDISQGTLTALDVSQWSLSRLSFLNRLKICEPSSEAAARLIRLSLSLFADTLGLSPCSFCCGLIVLDIPRC